ncbi:sulfotransferase family 2 domain-containing protein [Pseudoalteromonas marina]|uniref:Sulfotransferase family 2 domain-containing protein n=1 Tax=Pseudoalteromonas marina TaxID=267375 RepID=A0ABT9FDT7_9GAMM|nr:sulfotransferase family 2 domain-containing protein [Pseudoalteromonas marina]MDP2564800.1 sulfotransferase family 2 domain-containing protein [Pseudoalteromonas marina]
MSLVLFKSLISKNKYVESLFRSLHSHVPIHLKLKLSRKFVTAYSDLENDNKVIFVHVPKAAGNGITQSLFSLPSTGHYFLQKYKEDDYDKFCNYKKFTVVRNPWDRFVSAFHYLHSDKGGMGVWDNDFKDNFLKGIPDFKSFINHMIHDEKFKRDVLAWTHFIPQSYFLTLPSDNSLQNFDCICRFENLNADFESLKKILGKPEAQLAVINKSKHQHYKDYYTEQYMIDFISEIYKDDILLLGYEF